MSVIPIASADGPAQTERRAPPLAVVGGGQEGARGRVGQCGPPGELVQRGIEPLGHVHVDGPA